MLGNKVRETVCESVRYCLYLYKMCYFSVLI